MDNILITIIDKLLNILHKHQIKFVLMGGIATSILAKPRATFDVDGIISITDNKIKDLLLDIENAGFKIDKKQPLKLIQGSPFLTLYYDPYKTYIDLFISSNDFQNEIINRAKVIDYNDLSINIISPEDLILVKIQSGREKDMDDIREIIKENSESLDYKYLNTWAEKLGISLFLNDELKSLGLIHYQKK